ncbi:BlaI/MecI/CopY family transcriptional regulator [Streptomyces sp. NBC_01498]|uniref:BlaI/MecI/CopY family transcriptional regulator n=1 Tax=Streptomyces sp. NBC_01498 TaxID=2975870 RepID=UPI002E7B101C|nr:BlaI/MecI/CopY family transcriptional regulator [Streptomyces sp. NBC_01498]WTL25781.1 BlaI/MecI/CopY family transcriptional regulator [Streptomyces sp. NBC_01498]
MNHEPQEGFMAIRPFGELESEIMRIVWRQETPVTIHALISMLDGPRTPAYTTVMTVTERLREKGWLSRVKIGRSYHYGADRSADFYTVELMRQALDAATDREGALRHFAARLDPRETTALSQALADPPAAAVPAGPPGSAVPAGPPGSAVPAGPPGSAVPAGPPGSAVPG